MQNVLVVEKKVHRQDILTEDMFVNLVLENIFHVLIVEKYLI